MLTILSRMVHEMDLVSDLPIALSTIVKYICDELPIDASCIYLLDEKHAEYVLLATSGLNADLIGKLRIKLGEGLIGLVGEREEPVNLADARTYLDELGLTQSGYRGFLGIPLINDGSLVGVLTVQQRRRRRFDHEITGQLVTLGVQLAGDIAEACEKGGATNRY